MATLKLPCGESIETIFENDTIVGIRCLGFEPYNDPETKDFRFAIQRKDLPTIAGFLQELANG